MKALWGLKPNQAPFLIPINNQGFIDYQGVFKVIHGTLNQPIGTLDVLTVQEVSWLIEQSETEKKDYYEMVSYSVKNAMVSVLSGKDQRMFEEESEEENEVFTKEDRVRELNELSRIFNEDI